MIRRALAPIALILLLGGALAGAQWAPLARDAGADQRIAWWREARFGMFLHWGVYAIPGRGEWAQWNEQIPVEEYARLADQFKPEHFDPDAWAALAKEGGMKYMVLTSRHHDGFALFDDPGSNFTAMKSAAHRDIVADYVKAVRKAGLGVGLYYSPLDWRYPGFFFPGIYRASAEALRAQYERQMGELEARYGKLDVLWFDGGGDEWLGFGGLEWGGQGWHARAKDKPYSGAFDWHDAEVVSHLRAAQPGIVINDRTNAPADFRSREGDGALGDFENRYPWELCTTITEGAWGYQPDARVKPLATLIHLLAGAAGRDGNLLLNVGPQPDGRIPAAQADRVREIGRWLEANGESIYGTRGGPWLPGPYGVSTHRQNVIYIHVFEPTKDGKLELPELPVTVKKAALLHGADLKFTQADRKLVIDLSGASLDAADTVLKVEIDQPWTSQAVIPVPASY
ncbi:glycoside hydrolase family 29 [Acidobacteria bacterium AB60]|nr:glycoside hydrolase family 29 [Acidobacteria bacterium AB60]